MAGPERTDEETLEDEPVGPYSHFEVRRDKLTRRLSYVNEHTVPKKFDGYKHTGCAFCGGAKPVLENSEHSYVVDNKWSIGPHNEIVITNAHAESIADLSVDEIEDFFKLWFKRCYVYGDSTWAWMNKGAESGGSQRHLHAQLLGSAQELPDEVEDPCGVCGDVGPRLFEDDGWVLYVPEANTWPWELRVAGASCDGNLEQLNGSIRALIKGIEVLETSGCSNWNIVWHFGHRHPHAHLYGRRGAVAGLEMGWGAALNGTGDHSRWKMPET